MEVTDSVEIGTFLSEYAASRCRIR